MTEENGIGGVPVTGGAVFDQDLYGAADKFSGYQQVAVDDEEDDQQAELGCVLCLGQKPLLMLDVYRLLGLGCLLLPTHPLTHSVRAPNT